MENKEQGVIPREWWQTMNQGAISTEQDWALIHQGALLVRGIRAAMFLQRYFRIATEQRLCVPLMCPFDNEGICLPIAC